MPSTDEFLHSPHVAYFSMEVALRNEIPTYSGGLGVLAGDTVRSAADMDLPLVTVTLASRRGYFRQSIDDQGKQQEEPDPWDPAQWATPVGAKVSVQIEGREVWVGAWLYVLEGRTHGRQPVILLDTDQEENASEDREITHYLYGGDERYRLKQEIVLGIGGVRMLRAIGFDVIEYHMNEGHSALLTLDLLRDYAYPPEDVRPGEPRYDVPRVRELCNFTTHTPVDAGHDQFSYDLAQQLMGEIVDLGTLKILAGADRLNMTRLALNMSQYINGVAKRHAETSRRLYPGYQVRAITNGVHPGMWTSAPFFALYDRHLPGWCHEPEQLVRVDCCIYDEEIWKAHTEAKAALIEMVEQRCGVAFDTEHPIIGFARRMTAYKRPHLLFSDLDRLRAIATERPFQVVLAGKAHPRDNGGKELIAQLHKIARDLNGQIAVAYVPNYDLEVALAMTSGADVWLNTPLRPMEASGTSGMKAALNGVPQLSIMDGWWVEGCVEGVTGWAIGDDNPADGSADASALYQKLAEEVLPLYYDDRSGWVRVMKGAISKNGSMFHSHRMMRRYGTEAYLR